jgi:hypothetical protein
LAGNTRKQDRHSGENEKETLLEFLPLHSRERASVSPCGCSPVEVKAAARQSQKLGSGQISEDSEFLYNAKKLVNKNVSAFSNFYSMLEQKLHQREDRNSCHLRVSTDINPHTLALSSFSF